MNDFKKSKITDRIFLGSYGGAVDLDFLKNEKITKVISCLGEGSPSYNDMPIQQKCIGFNDFPNSNIIQYFKECLEFMDENPTDKIFVHCMCGVSRSSTIVIAYLMWKRKASLDETLEFVQNKRRFVSPNIGFINQLKIFEKLLKEKQYDLKKIDFKTIKWPQ